MKNAPVLLYLLLIVFSHLPGAWAQAEPTFESVTFLHIDSAITPATYEYLKHSFQKAPLKSLLVIKMNTPGGLISTTKDIMGLIGKEKRSVAVWVTPEGASAASAGAIISSAAHYIFMSPGTTIGAATPVGLNGDIADQDGKRKILNDLTALVRSFNELRSRNNKPFEEMILKASSFTEKEALKEKVINGVVSSEAELLKYFHSENLATQDMALTWEQKFLDLLSNPTTAYLLFLVGLALIYFEFQAPGGYVAGSIGSALLLLAAMAFQVLPMDWGYFGLLILGLILFVAELYVTSYGLLFILGLISFSLGSIFLFHGDLGFISVRHTALVSSFLGILFSVTVLTWYLWRENKKLKKRNMFSPLGSTGVVMKKHSPDQYQVKVHGEIWNAVSEENLEVDDPISVIQYDSKKLMMKIKSQRS
jgi:membrane-bound serine protease (ClpP class)